MAVTVVGLYKQAQDAQKAMQELQASGFQVDTMTSSAGNDALISKLQTGGVPNDDARLYAQGVSQGATLLVTQTDDAKGTTAQEIMERFGTYDIHSEMLNRMATAQHDIAPAPELNLGGAAVTGVAAAAATTATGATQTVNVGQEVTVPIVEEELEVGKRKMQGGGARIHTIVESRPVSEQVSLHEEHVTVDRRTVDRPLTNADNVFQEGTIEVTETREVPVVAKEARVVGEVVIGKQASDRTETVSDTVRRTDVEVEQLPTTMTPVGGTTLTGTTTTESATTTGTTGTQNTR